MDKDYQAECDLRTLVEAKKIMADKPRLTAAMKKRKAAMAEMAALDEKKGA
jgi:hypothetical protein